MATAKKVEIAKELAIQIALAINKCEITIATETVIDVEKAMTARTQIAIAKEIE